MNRKVDVQFCVAEYLEVVWEALRVQGGAECVATLDEAMERLFEDMLTQEGPDRISRMFK